MLGQTDRQTHRQTSDRCVDIAVHTVRSVPEKRPRQSIASCHLQVLAQRSGRRTSPVTNKKLSYREGAREASCQLKSCQLPRNSAETTYTTSPDQIDGMKLEI